MSKVISLVKQLATYFLGYQINWITDDSLIKICAKSRRIGMSFATSFRRVWVALRHHGHDCWVLSRDEGKAKEFIDYCKIWIGLINAVIRAIPFVKHGLYKEDTYVDDFDVTILRITFPNGSRIMALSSNPDSIAGVGGS